MASRCFGANPPQCSHCNYSLQEVDQPSYEETIIYWGCSNCQRVYSEEQDCTLLWVSHLTLDQIKDP